jgi:hypothetical protein
LYGTDIVCTAMRHGFSAYVIDAPVIHNTRQVESLAGGYMAAYRYMQRKWADALPLWTTIAPITRFGVTLMRVRLDAFKRRIHNRYQPPPARPDAVAMARALGYE